MRNAYFVRARSIKGRLSLVFFFLLLLVIVLGIESLRSLSFVNDASAQIRTRWLPGTRALGDLNNFTTDFPAAEAAVLHSQNASEQASAFRQIADLDRSIEAAQVAYKAISHDSEETELYRRFETQWREYRSIAARTENAPLDIAGKTSERHEEPESKSAYNVASETLGVLTGRNEASAREAVDRSDLVYTQARRRIAFAMILAGLLVLGATMHVTRSISAPLVDLAKRMHRLAASETSTEVPGTRRQDEIGEMARAVVVFRNNAIDLAQNRQALAQQAAMLQEKLAEEQRLTLLQRNFVSMASHEFRTPLAIIDGHAQRLISMRDRLTGGDLATRAHSVRSAVRRMTQLIDNLIGSARLIDGRIGLSYHPAAIDLRWLLRDACQQQRELTPDARVLELAEPQPLMVYGDANLLSQAFGNLLSNAVKYSPGSGLIQVGAAQAGMNIDVVVEDRGIGIPGSEQEQIFERYYRGSNTSGIAGSGVGLYLVKTIVDLHKGSIALDSREGDGSRFTVRLPALSAATPLRGRLMGNEGGRLDNIFS